ncbi:MAG TPA: mycofactocin biosynthesis peptidyl-dipeptidase MftE [Mycobacteriales bacterium]|jgi:creatinine amidohydrolase|nr:mycofactocin biosynthesis peptidyl-dipeptidase MftE [Mycobacteriales bacterium]
MTSSRLADLTWTDLDRRRPLLAVPLGSTEQHGPHLPLSTDTEIAVVLCDLLAAERDDVVVAPPLPYGSSGEHAGFPGTLSIGQDALEMVVVELVRSAAASFDGVILVSGHGGNAEPLLRAVTKARAEGHEVMMFLPRWEGDPHAGRVETSVMLVVQPDRVRLDAVAAGNTEPLPELLPRLRAEGVRAVSPNGVLGNPEGADAAEGSALLEAALGQLIADVTRWRA